MNKLGLFALFSLALTVAAPSFADRDGYHHKGKPRYQLDYRDYRPDRHHNRQHKNKGHHRDYRGKYQHYYHHSYNPYRYDRSYRHGKHYCKHHGRYYSSRHHHDGDYYKWIAGAVIAKELIHHTLPDSSHDDGYREYYYRRYSAK